MYCKIDISRQADCTQQTFQGYKQMLQSTSKFCKVCQFETQYKPFPSDSKLITDVRIYVTMFLTVAPDVF